ncbi:hypothetical protein FQN57_001561 [Myotisia sp. PD_48]|nr:hypothetical protein FQN57_001561 [Myotisia sp. PD_48]
MAEESQNNINILNLDPHHESCMDGRTIVTCRTCAGHASRGYEYCLACNGYGFSIYQCVHCNPELKGKATEKSSSEKKPADENSNAKPSSRRGPNLDPPKNNHRKHGDGGGGVGGGSGGGSNNVGVNYSKP